MKTSNNTFFYNVLRSAVCTAIVLVHCVVLANPPALDKSENKDSIRELQLGKHHGHGRVDMEMREQEASKDLQKLQIKIVRDDKKMKIVEVMDLEHGGFARSEYNKEDGKMTLIEDGKKIVENFDFVSAVNKYKSLRAAPSASAENVSTSAVKSSSYYSSYIGGNSDVLFGYYYNIWYVYNSDWNYDSWEIQAPFAPCYYWDVWDYEGNNNYYLNKFADNVDWMAADESAMIRYLSSEYINLASAIIPSNLGTVYSLYSFVSSFMSAVDDNKKAATYAYYVRRDIQRADWYSNCILY